ncbi:uncharacterized protein N7477_005079 [Penicillium maclennaniae]|uniref:uncharacterized protein n=1 Tax=Penicillium maclennaniae TaxID=1343394 RepID=UPI0025407ABA|nr:uncharacterized protein N7477_005079 [Penicillium maclennaniae]KAJ5675145.1 hypothetical protein N7477_005079 [Penicillium maclennaniae]
MPPPSPGLPNPFVPEVLDLLPLDIRTGYKAALIKCDCKLSFPERIVKKQTVAPSTITDTEVSRVHHRALAENDADLALSQGYRVISTEGTGRCWHVDGAARGPVEFHGDKDSVATGACQLGISQYQVLPQSIWRLVMVNGEYSPARFEVKVPDDERGDGVGRLAAIIVLQME